MPFTYLVSPECWPGTAIHLAPFLSRQGTLFVLMLRLHLLLSDDIESRRSLFVSSGIKEVFQSKVAAPNETVEFKEAQMP